MRKLIHFFCFALLSYTAVAQTGKNPYNLPLINTLEAFNKETAKDTNNEMIDLQYFIPHLVLDIRYANSQNFTNEIIYTDAKAFARRPVAHALSKIQIALDSIGLALKIFDAYRPYQATLRFYEIYPDTNFVAAPWYGSRHNRGAAVDLTLIEKKTGLELQMPTAYDDFSEAAAPTYQNLAADVIKNRNLLIAIMDRYGFDVYESEWWHYDFIIWERFSLIDLSFEQLMPDKLKH
ncbi:MAG: D-alanyl-D-alanine dipeptidase [Bacteroidetes bacterium HGW-Bacteroidetes-1]|jgi:D-alanyl-D-alanine dipeptidase|nr:MAG: D-alanyl-D-alanine dipeptidase [Bacteroidetes bacterium HGW-Bacteroidetes-1]